MDNSEIRQSLMHSNRMLMEGQTNRRLLKVLLEEFGSVEAAFVIDWIPEQGEDIYTVAVQPGTIATVEVPRDESSEIPIIEKVPFDQYRRDSKRMTKAVRRKLTVVNDLWGRRRVQAPENEKTGARPHAAIPVAAEARENG